MPDAQLSKRVAAVKTADAINAIEGVPPTDYAKALTAKWAPGELSFDAAKAALLEHHRRPVDPSWNRGRRDPYLYEDIPVLRNLLGIREEDALDLAEAELSRLHMAGLYETGFSDFSPAGLCQIHKALFGDVYEWAGRPRVINMIKRERVLAGQSVWYSNDEDIPRDLKLAFRDLKKSPGKPSHGRRSSTAWPGSFPRSGVFTPSARATPAPSFSCSPSSWSTTGSTWTRR